MSRNLNYPENKAIYITGASGFIGSKLVSRLANMRLETHALVRDKTDLQTVPGVKYEIADLHSYEDTRKIFRKNGKLGLVHLASSSREGFGLAELNSDLKMAANLIEAAKEGLISRIILIGSADQYGMAKPPQFAASVTEPINIYGLSKNLIQILAEHARKQWGVKYIFLRPFAVYGEGMPGYMFLKQLTAACVSHETFKMSHGKQKRDFIYVEDVVDAIYKAMILEDLDGTVLNVGTGVGTRLIDLAHMANEMSGAGIEIEKGGYTRDNDPGELVAEIGDTVDLLDWRPKTKLEDGLRLVIESERKKLSEKD